MTFELQAAAILAFAATLWAVTLAGAVLARLGFPLPAADRRIGMVDGLRGYLATAVFACHFVVVSRMILLGRPWEAAPVNFLAQLGGMSVGLFFMVTGLVFYPRIRAGLRGLNWPATMIGRLFRILPLCLFAFACVVAIIVVRIGWAPEPRFAIDAAKWITSYAQPDILGYRDSAILNGGVTWSLYYEWLFYLFVLPACALMADLVRGRAPGWTVPLALIAAGVAGQALADIKLARYLPLFAMGMLALDLVEGRSTHAAALRTRTMSLCGAAALLAALLWFDSPNGLAIGLLALFFWPVVAGNSYFGVLDRPGARVLGECSFGIYLLHALVLNVVLLGGFAMPAGLPGWALYLAMPTIGILVVIVSAAAHLVIERPGIAAGRRVARSLLHRGRVRRAELEVAP